jgi:hypothetical protein
MTPLAIALLFGQGPAVDLQAPISFEHRAAPVSRVLASLSEKSKIKLEALPAVAGDVVLVSVKEVPLQDLLQKIATVTSAEWRQDGEIYRLVPAAGIRNREAQDEFSAKVTAIRASIANRLKPPTVPAKPAGGDDVEDEEFAMPEGFDPSEIGDGPLLKIVQNLDLRALAALRTGDRVVFSSQPTRMQRPLPATSGPLIAKMVASHNETAKALKDADMDTDDALPDGVEMPQFVKDMMNQRTKPVGEFSKALLIASRSGFMGGFGSLNLELLLYDREGKVAYKTNTMLSETSSTMTRIIEAAQGKKKPAATKATPIELSPETKLVREVFSKAMGASGNVQLKPEAKAILYHPEIYDPLSFLPTDSLLAMAKKQGRPIVANLPDEMGESNAFAMASGENATVEQVEEDLRSAEEIRALTDPTFLLIKPSHPAQARAERLDREALAALMQAVDTKGIPSLDDVAAFAAKAENPMEGGVAQAYVMGLAPGAFSFSMSGFTNWDALRFYGLLSLDGRRVLAGGGRLPFGTLTSAQSGQLQKMAFGTSSNLQVEGSGAKSDEGFFSMMRMFGAGTDKDFRTEPTEVMANGLPSDGFVTANVVSDFFVTPVFDGDQPTMGPLSVLGVDEVAMLRMFRESPGFSQAMSGQMPSIDRVKLGERSVWNFQFHVAPKTSMKASLNDNRMAKGGRTYAMNDLPADYQKRIAAKVEEYKKSPLGAIGGMMGGMNRGQTPPP